MKRERITSPQNERVKSWVRLQSDGEARRETGQFLLEGKRLVAAALSTGRVRTLLYCAKLAGDDPLVSEAAARGAEVVELSAAAFRKIADTKNPQGVAAVAEMPRWEPKVLFGRDSLLLVACGIQDPGNLGSMLRSALAAGSSGFVAIRPSADVFHPRAVRGSSGAAILLPSARMGPDEFLSCARESGLRLVAASPRGGVDFRACDYSRPVGIVVGSEAHGVNEEIERVATVVTIPMAPGVESLNAAAAAAVLLFEAARRREAAPSPPGPDPRRT